LFVGFFCDPRNNGNYFQMQP